MREAGVDRTMLIIAHRMASVMTADRIVVLEDGRVVDQGTHDELLDRCDVYARLTRTQLVPSDGGVNAGATLSAHMHVSAACGMFVRRTIGR